MIYTPNDYRPISPTRSQYIIDAIYDMDTRLIEYAKQHSNQHISIAEFIWSDKHLWETIGNQCTEEEQLILKRMIEIFENYEAASLQNLSLSGIALQDDLEGEDFIIKEGFDEIIKQISREFMEDSDIESNLKLNTVVTGIDYSQGK